MNANWFMRASSFSARLNILPVFADRQFVAEFDVARIFVGGELGFAPFDEFFVGQFVALFQNDKGLDLFAEPFVGDADDGDRARRPDAS